MLRIIAVGKVKEKPLKDLIADYHKRIKSFYNLTQIEIADQPEQRDVSQGVKREGEEILKRIKTKEFVVLLDLQGAMLDSVSLAERLEFWSTHNSELCFVIGGSNGVSEAVRQRADFLWQLSELTFPHQMVRLILLEQLYRSCKIINNQSYHK